MIILFYFALLINFLYSGLLFSYFLKWKEVRKSSLPDFNLIKNWPSVTIVIPVRNEENNLNALFEDLENLNYPSEQLEIIFVNDHSGDNSLLILERKSLQFKIYSLSNTFGKKAALDFGIRQANKDWIVTIDADIHFNNDWLKYLMLPSTHSDVVMICGLVKIDFEEYNTLSKFQSMEFSMLQASGFAALKGGNSLLNSGANLAFKKENWLAIGAYSSHQHIASGDDTFLLFEMMKSYPGKVVSSVNAIVSTKSQNSFKELVIQRLRWSRKTVHYKEIYVCMVGALVILSSLFLIISVFSCLFLGSPTFTFLMIIFFIRGMSEWLLLDSFTRKNEFEFQFFDKLMMTFLYPFFVFCIVLIQPFSKLSWKGRKL